jgi:1-acyl-sn-glycerol-3-phosphate acyltransferase
MSQTQNKPRNESFDPKITFLPRLTRGRRFARHLLRAVLRLLVWLFTDLTVTGGENLEDQLSQPVLVVSNHLGDVDLIAGVAVAPRFLEVVSKAELRHLPILGWLMNLYGVIWVHRGQPDRHALRAVLQGLEQGRPAAIAPEGRESLTGALEEGTHGAAFLAMKAGVPILPVTITGTENRRLCDNIKHLRRTPVTVTIGEPFRLARSDSLVFGERHADLEHGTQIIMRALAHQLPAEYRGVYQSEADIIQENEGQHGSR